MSIAELWLCIYCSCTDLDSVDLCYIHSIYFNYIHISSGLIYKGMYYTIIYMYMYMHVAMQVAYNNLLYLYSYVDDRSACR